jgi:hypothetical protein
VMRAGSFFPFQTTYYLNGHSFIEQELTRAQVGCPSDPRHRREQRRPARLHCAKSSARICRALTL